MTATPAIEGWFTTGSEPALIGSQCTSCGCVFFPRTEGFCRNPVCDGEAFEDVELSRRGSDLVLHRRAVPAAAAVHPGQPTRSSRSRWRRSSCPRAWSCSARSRPGTASATCSVGQEAELVVETLYTDDEGERTIWRWKPVVEMGEEADQ